MIKVITGLVIGILGGACLWLGFNSLDNTERIDTIEEQCMTTPVFLLAPDTRRMSPFISIGEVVICGSDWKISNVMGPDAETWYSRVKLRDWNPEEFKLEPSLNGADK